MKKSEEKESCEINKEGLSPTKIDLIKIQILRCSSQYLSEKINLEDISNFIKFVLVENCVEIKILLKLFKSKINSKSEKNVSLHMDEQEKIKEFLKIVNNLVKEIYIKKNCNIGKEYFIKLFV